MDSESRYIPVDIQTYATRQAKGICRYCRRQLNQEGKPDTRAEYDHLIPMAKGGQTVRLNIQVICRKCNRRKSDKLQDRNLEHTLYQYNLIDESKANLVKRTYAKFSYMGVQQ